MNCWSDKLAFTVEDAILASGVSRRSLYRAMASGALRFATVCRRRRIAPEDLKSWLLGGSAA